MFWLSERSASAQPGLDTVKTWTEILEKVVTSLAVLIGGIWAYFKFAKGRTLRPKVAIEMSGQWLKSGRKHWLQIRIQVENIGTSKVGFRQTGTWLEVKALAAGQSAPPDYANWKSFGKYEILDGHDWTEPGEKVSDDLMLNLGIRPAPVRLDARLIVKRKIFSNIEVPARCVLPADAIISRTNEGKG